MFKRLGLFGRFAPRAGELPVGFANLCIACRARQAITLSGFLSARFRARFHAANFSHRTTVAGLRHRRINHVSQVRHAPKRLTDTGGHRGRKPFQARVLTSSYRSIVDGRQHRYAALFAIKHIGYTPANVGRALRFAIRRTCTRWTPCREKASARAGARKPRLVHARQTGRD